MRPASSLDAIRLPDASLLKEVAGRHPCNPFMAPGYVAARQTLGATPWVLGRRMAPGVWDTACIGFLTVGRLGRGLEIPSCPGLPEQDAFWAGLREFCTHQRITEVQLDTFASEAGWIPMWGRGVRRLRREYVVDLTVKAGRRTGSTNHLRNAKRAQRSGVTIRRIASLEACEAHVRLIAASLDRRRERGEQAEGRDELRVVRALVAAGGGELFQACLDGAVQSSVLVLLAERGAYYHSAGTSPEGMACGASHLLIWEIITALTAQGYERFNLGGADATQGGLERFKQGFGSTAVELSAVRISLASPLLRAARLLHGTCRETWGRMARQWRRREDAGARAGAGSETRGQWQ